MTILVAILIVIVAVIILLMIKSRSMGPALPPAEMKTGEREGLRGFEGVYSGVDYVVDYYDPTTMTVEIHAPGGVGKELEINARNGRVEVPDDERKTEIEALLGLGANYLDIGYNTDRIAAEYPAGSFKPDKDLVEKTVRLLIKIRDKSS